MRVRSPWTREIPPKSSPTRAPWPSPPSYSFSRRGWTTLSRPRPSTLRCWRQRDTFPSRRSRSGELVAPAVVQGGGSNARGPKESSKHQPGTAVLASRCFRGCCLLPVCLCACFNVGNALDRVVRVYVFLTSFSGLVFSINSSSGGGERILVLYECTNCMYI